MNLVTKRWLSWFILMLMAVCFNINCGVSSSANYNPQSQPPGLSESDYLPPSDVPPRRLRSNNEGVIVDQRRLPNDDAIIIPQPNDPTLRRLSEMNNEMSVPDAPQRRPQRRRLREEIDDAIGPEFKGRRLREKTQERRLREENVLPVDVPPSGKPAGNNEPNRRLREETDDVIGPEFKGRRLREQNNDAVPDPWQPIRRLNDEEEEIDNDAVGPEFIQRSLQGETSNGIIVHDDDKDIIVQDKESLSRRLQKKMKQQRQNQTSLPPVDLPIETSMDSNDLPMTTNDDEHENNNTRKSRPFPRNRKLIDNNNDENAVPPFPPGPY